MPGTAVMVRRAGPGDAPVLAGVLARAFLDDPIYAWVFPDRQRREKLLPRYMRSLPLTVYGSLGPNQVAVAGEHTVGAMVQCEPGRAEPSWWTTLRTLPAALRAVGPTGLAGLIELDRAVGSVRPARPHRYVFHLGTDPGWWGHGVGSALLHQAVADSDTEGVPTYLECKPDITSYYERFGFTVTARVPFERVELWGMVREPG